MVKVSVNRFISRRIEMIRRKVEANTQRLRERTLKNLDEIFRVSARIARGEIKHQRINGKMVRINLKQRRRWLHIAEHVAKIMNRIAPNFNEQEIYIQLDRLERLVNEANAKAED